MKRTFSLIVTASCLLILLMGTAAIAQVDLEKLSAMKARSIGPAGMSGRVAAIEALAENPDIIYVGAATGGVWKSKNGGTTFKPVFDDQPVSSIGAIAVYQKNPSIVWVGTGEGNPRNSSGVGNGVYKSIDAGDTWTHIGLNKTEKISRIRLHPENPEIAYAAALGTSWGENPERGVFKTTDGGKTWNNVLFIDDKTGCADLVMDPKNPNKLFAAMWEHRRDPWFFKSGGPGSGLYVTYDGGENWKKIYSEEGLPEGELGRIGLAISNSDPDVVYALVEAKKSALCRSDDGGKTWKTVNSGRNVNPRPFYYCDIRVDPRNENRVYQLASRLSVSNDGGRSFSNMTPSTPLYPGFKVHTDHHALWIDPNNGQLLINGNDGGVAISRDRGENWLVVKNLPLAQYYHINVDMEVPFNVYGGLQDNDAWIGPSDVWEEGGIRNCHWNVLIIGDGFYTENDPTVPNVGYTTSQGGNLIRFNIATGEYKGIKPAPRDSVKLRFNWNAAFAMDPYDPNTIYYGSQYIHKSIDRGDTWTVISPDLTTNDPEKQKQQKSGGLTIDVTAAENHTTILSIAPSPVERNVIWAGTDDGNIQLTRDGGATWDNLTDRIDRNLPDGIWCPHIEASKFEAGAAYVVFDDHRRNNWKTYIYKTDDYGRNWKDLSENDEYKDVSGNLIGFVHVIEEDPVNRDILYLGTEFGLFISLDGGKGWMKWTHGIPTAPVRDIIVHPRDHDLVIGTHGRAVYVLDDVRPLREISGDILDKPLHLFDLPDAYLHRLKRPRETYFPGDDAFLGEPKPFGAMITFSLKIEDQQDENAQGEEKPEKNKNEVFIEISDANGELVRKFKTKGKDGLNRVNWNLRRDGVLSPGAEPPKDGILPGGIQVIPGYYTITLKYNDNSASGELRLLADPQENFSMDERDEKYRVLLNSQEKQELISEAVNRINKITRAVDNILELLKDKKDEPYKELDKEGKELKKRLTEVKGLFSVSRGQGGFSRRGDDASSKLRTAQRYLSSTYGAASASHLTYLDLAEQSLNIAIETLNEVLGNEVAAFKNKIDNTEFQLLPGFESLDPDWKKKK